VARFADLAGGPGQQPPPPAAGQPPATAGELHPYVAKLLGDECAAVRGTLEGGRNSRLREAALKVGHWVPAYLTFEQAEAALTEAGRTSGLPDWEVERVVLRGLAAGMSEPRTVPATPAATVIEDPTLGGPSAGGYRIRFTWACDIKPRLVRWLWPGLVPQGELTLLAGRGGEGKSTLTLKIAAMASRGELPSGPSEPINVGVVATEDDWSTTIVPRLIVAGADMAHVGRIDRWYDVDGVDAPPVFPTDLQSVEAEIVGRDIRLLILDPAASSLATTDLGRMGKVRAALGPLIGMLHRTGCTAIGLHHFRKGGGKAADLVSESHAFRDIVRCLLLLVAEPDTGRRVVTVDKINSGQPGRSFEFEVASRPFTIEGETAEYPVAGDLGPTDMSVQDLIDRSTSDPDRDDAEAFIVDYLTERGGEAPAGEVIKAGRAAGLSDQTVKDARRRCRNPRITTHKADLRGGWLWGFAKVAETAQGGEDGTPRAHMPPSPPSPPSGAKEPRLCSGCGAEPVAPFGVLCPACRDLIDPRATGRMTRDEDQ